MPETKNEVRGSSSSSLGEIDSQDYLHPVQLVQGQGELEGGENCLHQKDIKLLF